MKKTAEKKSKFNTGAIVAIFLFSAIATLSVIVGILKAGDESQKEYPFELSFDSSVSAEEQTAISARFEGKTATGGKPECKVSAETVYELPETYVETKTASGVSLVAGRAFYSIKVPVVDFYDGLTDVVAADVSQYELIDTDDITPEKRVLSVDGNYYLDTPTAGAEFRLLNFDCSDSKLNLAASTAFSGASTDSASTDSASTSSASTFHENLFTFAQTGVTAISRALTLTLNGKANGDGAYFAERIKDFLSAKDLTHISNESSFVDGCQGGTNTMMLCSDWRTIDTITAIGTDIVELTGNHNNNFGADTNVASIEKYHELGMSTFGGGTTAGTAKIPIRIHSETATESEAYTSITNTKSANITLLGYNNSTSTVGNGELAYGDRAGANGWDEENAKKEIAAAKERGDFVIVDIQFSECYSYPDYFGAYPACDAPISGQQTFFRHVADLGADLVIGTQAHQPQTFEIYNGVPIYYGLGNLFFDQTYWLDTERGLILTHYFKDGKYIQTRISPTTYDSDHQVELMDNASATDYLNRLINSSSKGE